MQAVVRDGLVRVTGTLAGHGLEMVAAKGKASLGEPEKQREMGAGGFPYLTSRATLKACVSISSSGNYNIYFVDWL